MRSLLACQVRRALGGKYGHIGTHAMPRILLRPPHGLLHRICLLLNHSRRRQCLLGLRWNESLMRWNLLYSAKNNLSHTTSSGLLGVLPLIIFPTAPSILGVSRSTLSLTRQFLLL